MSFRLRHCVECPKCQTRYLVGFSPYPNGAHLVPLVAGSSHAWTLYCSCARPPIPTHWCWDELDVYDVSSQAHSRGYGSPDEIVRA